MDEKVNNCVNKFLTEYIENLELFHSESIIKLLSSPHLNVQKRGLLISTFDSPFYSIREVEKLQEISNQIEEAFKDRSSTATKKRFLSTKEKEAWQCECGKVNNDENT